MPPDPEVWQARRLTGRFLDGVTTADEERRLYAFYSLHAPGSLPDDLEQARAMFGWYAALGTAGAGCAVKARRKNRRLRYAAAGVAALLVLAAAAAFWIMRSGTGGADETLNACYATYSGSYIIRNGERVSDIEVIYPELVAGEQLADSIGNDSTMIEEAIGHIDDPELIDYIRTQIFNRQ